MKSLVASIRSRYLQNSIIRHHGDCEIYSQKRCDCGLLHDLRPLDYSLAKILFKKYEEDLYLHETGLEMPLKDEEAQKESLRILEEIFGKVIYTSEDIDEEYDYMKKCLVCFTVEECPSVFERLEEWREEWRKEQCERL